MTHILLTMSDYDKAASPDLAEVADASTRTTTNRK
jgi:hypothetical protein